MDEITELQVLIGDFAKARSWEQFHNPKNLTMALAGEVGELAAEFQWLTLDQSLPGSLCPEKKYAVEMEIADVAIYLFRLAEVLDVDLVTSVKAKMHINADRFPL